MVNPTTEAIQSPYVSTSRTFPQDPEMLQPVLTKRDIEFAQAINLRTNGIYDKFQIVTGEQWFSIDTTTSLRKRQSLRQVYEFTLTGASTSFPHNIAINSTTDFTHIYGVLQNAPVGSAGFYRPLPWVDVGGGGANAIELDVTPTDIVITTSAFWTGSLAYVILEYILG